MNKVSLFICCHRSIPAVESKILVPVQVGSACASVGFGMLKDDDGENISAKNKFFCELTAQYWIWKNCQSEYVGLFHYRRFLNFNNDDGVFHCFNKQFSQKYGLTEDCVLAVCREYDVILPRKSPHIPGNKSLYECYERDHIITDMDKVLEIIGRKYPEMKKTADFVIKNNVQGYFMNIAVASKVFFDRYSAWLFDILFELEKEIQADVDLRNDYQKRVYGFVAERLMNVYIEYMKQTEGIKIKELPMLFWEEDEEKWRKYKIRRFKRKFLVALGLGKEKWKEQYA